MAHQTVAAPDCAVTPDRLRSGRAFRVSCQNAGFALGLAETLLIAGIGAVAPPLYTALSGVTTAEPARGLGLGLLAGALHGLGARAAGLYRLPVLIDPLTSARRLAAVLSFVLLAITAIFFCLKAGAEFSRGALALFAAGLAVGCALTRLGAAAAVAALLARGAISGRPAFLFGDARELAGLDRAYLLKSYGLGDAGRLAFDRSADAADLAAVVAEVPRLAREAGARAIVVATAWHDMEVARVIEAGLRASPLSVRLIPLKGLRDRIDRLALVGDPSRFLVTLQRAPMSHADHAFKRVVDVLFSAAALILLSPILLLAAAAIKLDSKGPVFFLQRRTGFDHRPFTILKFRTMAWPGSDDAVIQATRRDARVTQVGRLLRRSSIDELPQLLNVLRGDMSLVGPRPHAMEHDAKYRTLIEAYVLRHNVRPGMTGWAQINGQRGETAQLARMARRIDLDLWYIDNWSPLLDLRILIRTAFEVIRLDAY